MSTCAMDGCGGKVVARTLCGSHYAIARKTGALDGFPVRQAGARRRRCEIEDCDEFRFGGGLCQKHYWRKRRRGTTELRGPVESVGYIDSDGYKVVYKTGHPLARPSGRISEHRLVAFAKYGPGEQACHWCDKPLTWERVCVDHLDGVTTHNAPENLVTACAGCNSRRARQGNPVNFQARSKA